MQETVEFNIPWIFSLELQEADFPENLKAHVAFINQRIKLFLNFEQGKVKTTLELLKRLDQQIDEKFFELRGLGSIETLPVLLWHLKFLNSYLIFKFNDPCILDGLRGFCTPTALPHPLLYWYRAIAYAYLADAEKNYTNHTIAGLIECIRALAPVSMPHRDGVLGLLVIRLNNCSEYPDANLLMELPKLCPDISVLADLSGPVAKARHKFVLRQLARRAHFEYFNAHETDFVTRLNRKAPRNICVPRQVSARDFPEHVPKQLVCNQYDLLKFVSHLGCISMPMLRFNFAELDSHDAEESNKHILAGLTAAGFLNSENMVIAAKCFTTSGAGDKVVKPEFLSCCCGLLRESFPSVTAKWVDQAGQAIAATFVEGYDLAEQKKSLLGLFKPISALFLLRQTILSVNRKESPPEITLAQAKLNQAVALLDDCLHHAVGVKQEIKSIKKPVAAEHDSVFKGAGTIVDDLWETPRDLILQAGVPVKDIKRGSAHAFYVCLKFSEIAGVTNFRIILFNGGPGLTLHARDESLAESEFQDQKFGMYHPVASQNFPVNDDENKVFLQHYLYKLLTLAYSIAADQQAFKEMVTNIYLGAKDTEKFVFKGYGSYTRTEAFRERMNGTYRAQLSENCTIYNLKKALQFVTGMSLIEYGEFEDLLLYGAQRLLAEALAPAASAAASGAAAVAVPGSGALMEAGDLFGFDLGGEISDFPCEIAPFLNQVIHEVGEDVALEGQYF